MRAVRPVSIVAQQWPRFRVQQDLFSHGLALEKPGGIAHMSREADQRKMLLGRIDKAV
jgi:hypothetical protein